MAILTDLPNELLLTVIADVSPLYIDSFVLTCKRIHSLGVDTTENIKLWEGALCIYKKLSFCGQYFRNLL